MTTRSVTFRVHSTMTAFANCDCFLRLNMRDPYHKHRVIEQCDQILAYRAEHQRCLFLRWAHGAHLPIHQLGAYLIDVMQVRGIQQIC